MVSPSLNILEESQPEITSAAISGPMITDAHFQTNEPPKKWKPRKIRDKTITEDQNKYVHDLVEKFKDQGRTNFTP